MRKSVKDLADGAECTDLFHAWEGFLPISWANQESEEDARLFLRDLLGTDGIPLEGSPGESIQFHNKLSGFGYAMTYEVGEDRGDGFASVTNVHVYRASAYDRDESKAVRRMRRDVCKIGE